MRRETLAATDTQGDWHDAGPVEALKNGSRTVVRAGARQVVVLLHGDTARAFDNRCPHQGYPLKVGRLDSGGCTLTCDWHNWKFDLESGTCLTGGDRLRVYPTKVEGGHVWVDVADPSPDRIRAAVLADLGQAYARRQYGRIARELARLALQGLNPEDGLVAALGWARDHLEWGTRHSMAAAADWLALARGHQDSLEEQLICLAEAIDHLADDTLREPVHAYPEGEAAWDGPAFLAAVEAEDEAAALARVRGALAAGMGVAELVEWLARAALAHYNSFGHSIIYTEKALELEQALGPRVAGDVLPPLVRHLVHATREDLIPEFQDYARARIEFPGFGMEDAVPDHAELRGRGVKGTLDWVREHAAFHTPEAVFAALVAAAGENLRDFDESWHHRDDTPTKDHVGWLDFTHALTMADALRVACARDAALWPAALLQLGCFVARNQRYLLAEPATEWAVEDPAAFHAACYAAVTDHGYADPIYSAHLVKTWVAVRNLERELGGVVGAAALAGLNRLFQAQLKQKHVRRQVRESLGLVARDFPRVAI